jgi:hypothetical protein
MPRGGWWDETVRPSSSGRGSSKSHTVGFALHRPILAAARFGLIDRGTFEVCSRLDVNLYACVRFVASSRPVMYYGPNATTYLSLWWSGDGK